MAAEIIKKNWYRYLGMALICICSLSYAFWGRDFAEYNIQFPFLSFPIFVGEWLLLACLMLLGVLWKKAKIPFQRGHWILAVYLIWIIIKAIHGYLTVGSLALRHSALFYYPLFALLGYCFYDRIIFNTRWVNIFFLISMVCALYLGTLFSYFRVPFFILYVLLVMKLDHWLLRIVALLCLIKFPFSDVLITSRTLMIGLVICFVFISAFFAYLLWSSKKKYAHLVVSLVLLAAIIMAFKKVNPDAITSLFSHNELIELYQHKEAEIAILRRSFRFKDIKPELYNNELQSVGGPSLNSAVDYILNDPKAFIASQGSDHQADDLVFSGISSIIENRFIAAQKRLNDMVGPQVELLNQEKISSIDAMAQVQEYSILIKEEVMNDIKEEIQKVYGQRIQSSHLNNAISLPKLFDDISSQLNNSLYFVSAPLRDTLGNTLETRYGNIIFRFYIWKDMWEDMLAYKVWILGMNMGHPQRSKRLEMLQWAIGEWSRDGWITPHNSWFHMFYRGGIVGLGLVFATFFLFGKMVCRFLRARSLNGVLLAAILLYFMIMSCFLVILELPYNAIPFWSLFGLLLAYSQELVLVKIIKEN